uniref:Uncharacterized protein n=1 Tax=Strombidium inclinatum TaxID=197538 RepID=A0A7S3ITL5_9SPIT|mmetsp:Transcript_35484/g.54272  ORF Transcript_35484/g.54272 Transcript_35484/m.54272 type:complete len:159 (+) Transcript_35484:5651-6127(+)
MGPLTHLVYLILLFIRNSTFENRSNKVHFFKNDDFLPCLMAFLTQHNQHPLVRGQTAAVLWSLVHNHQGIKAAINKSAVISELQNLRSQYQRDVDKLGYLSALSDPKQPSAPEALNDYHANLTVDDVTRNQEAQAEVVKQTNEFVAKALSGILTLVQV